MKKILIIEDNKEIAEIEKDYLEASEYYVDIAYTGEDGINLARDKTYDLIILDIMMPNMDGFQVCRELVKISDIPIIFVSAKNENLDKIKALGLGGADYIVKPFEPSELIARVNSHIKRYNLLTKAKKEEKEKIIVKDLLIEVDSRRVYLNNEEMFFPNKEFDLLLFLARNPNIVFNKQSLLDRVWGVDSFVSESTVAVHINRIRDKIENNSLEPVYIETLWGAGYRFIEN